MDKIAAMYKEMLSARLAGDVKNAIRLSDEVAKMVKNEESARHATLKRQQAEKDSHAA